jgi:hypothetical protein
VRNLLLGFVAGVLLTTALFALFDGRSNPTASARSAGLAASPGATATSHWGAAPFSADATASIADAPTPSSPTTVHAAAEPAHDGLAAAAVATRPEDADQGTPEEQLSKLDPFLHDDFSRVIAEDRAHPRSPSQWHDDFLQETRDPAFADKGERQLNDYFGRLGSRGITLLGVQCRATICELKLTEPLGVPSQFRSALDEWYGRHRAIGPSLWAAADGDNGQRYIVTIVRRRPSPKP